MESGMIRTFAVEGQTIACRVELRQDASRGRSLVFLHGSSGDHTIWARQYGPLRGLYNIAVPDFPGHGASAGEVPEDIGGHIPWLKGLFGNLLFEKPVLVGHSMGAAVALAFALRHGEKLGGIVLVGGGAKMPVNPMILTGLKTDPAAIVAMIPRFAVARKNRERIGSVLAGRLSVFRTDTLYRNLAACSRFDVTAEAGDIRVPSLIVCGAEDKMTPPALSQDLEKRIPGARLELIENAGHFAMMEEPEAFNGILRAFVDALV